MKQADVVVVGGGPVGLFAGLSLLQQGVDVVVLEARAGGSAGSRAIGIHPPALRCLEQLGLIGAFLEAGTVVREASVFVDRRPLTRLRFDGCDPQHDGVLMVPQQQTERLLAEPLQDAGRISYGVRVDSLESTADDIVLRGDGVELQVRWVLVCDGRHSALRQALGVGMPVQAYAHGYIMGDFPDATDFGAAAAIFLGRQSLVESLPLPQNTRRWVVRLRSPQNACTADEIAAIVGQRTGHALDAASCTMTSAFAAEQGIAERLRKGRAILLGDAAHVVSPIGGQGMNLGWLGAVALIPLLTQILNSTDPAAPALSAWERQVRSNWQRARRRAEANMFHGRPLRCPQLHRALMHLMLDTPLRHRFVRHYTMDGFT